MIITRSTLRYYSPSHVLNTKRADVRPICTNTFRVTEFDWGPLNLSKQVFDIRARVMTVELDTSGHVSENITLDSHDS